MEIQIMHTLRLELSRCHYCLEYVIFSAGEGFCLVLLT